MPTYEFVCPDGHTFDKLYRNMSTAPGELACPVCGKLAIRKISGGAGLVFKGSGFYITDYGKDGKKGAAKPPSDASSSASSSKGESGSSNGGASPNAPAAASGDAKPKSPDSK